MFKNREQVGKLLADKLIAERENLGQETVVLAVPRGSLIIGRAIAQKLACPLDVIVVKKLHAPGSQELAIGAIGETQGSTYINENLARQLGVNSTYLTEEIDRQKKEIRQREFAYRQNRPAIDLLGKKAIIVDDGAATGATLIAAAREVWAAKPKKVIIAIPVAPPDTVKKLELEADQVEVLETPQPFFSVGQFYEEFPQVEDDEVIKILKSK